MVKTFNQNFHNPTSNIHKFVKFTPRCMKASSFVTIILTNADPQLLGLKKWYAIKIPVCSKFADTQVRGATCKSHTPIVQYF